MGYGQDDDTALLNAARERAEIVRRYDRGLDPEAPVDEWENPAFEVYHTTDRYGFIHDSRLPDTRGEEEKLSATKEAERANKWQKMNSAWKKYYGGEKLRARVYKGIPDRWRSVIWKKLLRVDEMKEAQRDVYRQMRERARTTSPDIRQIDLDVNRTYRNHVMFRERYGIKQTHLFHVLAAYSMYNTEVGYCQGMSQIAALLLMYMDEEDAFWGLSQLLTNKKHAMHGLFIPGFPKLLRFQDHFEATLKKFMPKIYKYMNSNMIPPSLYAIKWFMQCFLDRTPFTLTLRLYDIYMLEGERILVPMAFTIFKIHKKKLLRMSMESFVHFLQQDLEKDFGLDDDAVIQELEITMQDLRRSRMDLPAKPKDDREIPHKPFGTITFPTLQELENRQNGQIHINDESEEHPVPVEQRRPVTITKRPSTASEYDNNNGVLSANNGPVAAPRRRSRVSLVSEALSPVDSPLSEFSQRSLDSPLTECHRHSVESPVTPITSHPEMRKVLETHLPVDIGVPGSPPCDHSPQDGLVELSLDLSDEEVGIREEFARDQSLSPPPGESRMFVRAAGFRVRSPRGDPVSPERRLGSMDRRAAGIVEIPMVRPFPVSRSPSRTSPSSVSPTPVSPLHMVSPRYEPLMASPPRRGRVYSPPAVFSPPAVVQQRVFHTFGGRHRQGPLSPLADPPFPGHPPSGVSYDNLSLGTEASASTLPPRYVMQRPPLPALPTTSNKFYVLGGDRRRAQTRQYPPDDPNHKPVFL